MHFPVGVVITPSCILRLFGSVPVFRVLVDGLLPVVMPVAVVVVVVLLGSDVVGVGHVLFGFLLLLFALPIDFIAEGTLAVLVVEALRDSGFSPEEVSLVCKVDALDLNGVDVEADGAVVGRHF